MSEWWERETLRFECEKGCTQCCRRPGIVRMNSEDIRRAADYLGLSVAAFKGQFLSREGTYWNIEVMENKPCPFLLESGCRIHPAKPAQCRSFPFWDENLVSQRTWKETQEECPGIGTGPVMPSEAVHELKRMG